MGVAYVCVQSLRDDDKEANATLRLAVRKLELVRDLVDRTEESLQHRRDRIRSLRESLNGGNTVDIRDLGSDWEGDDDDSDDDSDDEDDAGEHDAEDGEDKDKEDGDDSDKASSDDNEYEFCIFVSLPKRRSLCIPATCWCRTGVNMVVTGCG